MTDCAINSSLQPTTLCADTDISLARMRMIYIYLFIDTGPDDTQEYLPRTYQGDILGSLLSTRFDRGPIIPWVSHAASNRRGP